MKIQRHLILLLVVWLSFPADSLVAANDTVFWIGTEQSPAEKAIVESGITLTKARQVTEKGIYIQGTDEANVIKVYNAYLRKWIKASISAPVLRHQDGKRQLANGKVDTSNISKDRFLSSVKLAASCRDYVQVEVHLTSIPPEASVYLGNWLVGDTDKNGILKANAGAICRNEWVDVRVAKPSCSEYSDFFQVKDNPHKYVQRATLQCSDSPHQDADKRGKH